MDTTLDSLATSGPKGDLTIQPYLLSVNQYHRMIEDGILSSADRVELIEGQLRAMTPIGIGHALSATAIARRLDRLFASMGHARVQQPITLARSEPEPDVSVVMGDEGRYRDHHPLSSDIMLVVEVADTSLAFDRAAKAAIYAAASIPEYWIVNLSERQIEVHRGADVATQERPAEFRVRAVHGENDAIAITWEGRNLGEIRVSEVLP